MRRLLLAAAVLCASACAGPTPCTQALCPWHQSGSYRVTGWNKSVTVAPGQPAIPIVSDSTVEVLDGKVEFVNGLAVVRADTGASFQFSVSSGPIRVSSILVASGEVSVALSSTSAPSRVAPGAPYPLPIAK
jgi:hypothetical protein